MQLDFQLIGVKARSSQIDPHSSVAVAALSVKLPVRLRNQSPTSESDRRSQDMDEGKFKCLKTQLAIITHGLLNH